MLALKDLCKTTLYKNEGVSIDRKWEHLFDQLTQSNGNFLSNVESLDSTDVDMDAEPISETIVHGFGQSHLIDDLDTSIIQIAPSEGFHPLGIFHDKFSEELNFPTLFYGYSQPTDVLDHFSYQNISQWELLHRSNDFSTHITNIFFKAI